MAINIKPNQALAFGPQGPTQLPCNCGGSYCQPVQTDDVIRIQGSATHYNNTNLSVLANWSFGTGWYIDSGVLVGHGVPTNTTQAISNVLGLGAGRIYDIYINASSRYVFNGGLGFEGPNQLIIGTMDDIGLEVGGHVIISGTASNNGTYTIASYTTSFLGWVITTVQNTLVLESTTGTATLPDWQSPLIDKGYRFKFNGEYLELPVVAPDTTGNFTSRPYLLRYTYTVNTLIDDRLRIECSDPDVIVEIKSVEIKLISRVGIAVYKDGSLFYSAFNPSSIVTYYPASMRFTPNNAVTSEVPFVPVLWNASINFFSFAGTVIGCSQISFYDSTSTGATPDKNNVSNCIDTRASHPCTLVFNAVNNDNAFGFEYVGEPQFQHFLRAYCKMDVTAYPEETETPYIFSNNTRVLMFARRDKEYTIFIGDAPDHIHNCLSHMRLHDSFNIGTGIFTDLAAYVKESAYELNRRKTSSLKQATFTVREKQGIASNFPCR